MSNQHAIFISYRREDSSYPTDFIYRALIKEFGEDAVFKDDDSIPDGVDFRKYIDLAVGSCDVLLAVIGRQWIHAKDKQGHRRIDNPSDFVRLEIESALSRNIPVIPVLVDGALIPNIAELPKKLGDLVYRNARNIRSGPDFDSDIARLISRIQDHSSRLQSISFPVSYLPEPTEKTTSLSSIIPKTISPIKVRPVNQPPIFISQLQNFIRNFFVLLLVLGVIGFGTMLLWQLNSERVARKEKVDVAYQHLENHPGLF